MKSAFVLDFFRSGKLFSEIKVIHYFRYISYILTSGSYLLWGELAMISKLSVVVFLGIAAVILNYIYKKYRSNLTLIKVMIIIEILGNILVLLPSGGINSPYIWYSLNVIIVSAYFLNAYFLISYILIFMLSFVSYYLLQSSAQQFDKFIVENSSLILSYFLIVIAAYLLIMSARKINSERMKVESVNGQLVKANKMLAASMDDIAALYQNVHAFVNGKNKDRLGGLILEYTLKITKAPFAFLYYRTDEYGFAFETDGNQSADAKNTLLSATKMYLDDISADFFESDMPIRDMIGGYEMIICAVKNCNNCYGVLGTQIDSGNGEIMENQYIDQIRMLSALSGILFESFQYEVRNQELLVSEEQHRIANEIHDGVSQRLFYISCKISDILTKAESDKQSDFTSELYVVRDALKAAAKELRETIYSNGARNNGAGFFEDSIRKYIGEIKELNAVSIDLNMSGSFDNISYDLKKVIFRIVGEGCGNAIRHGKSKEISIKLLGDCEKISIEILDDGSGFDLYEVTRNNGFGLGIRNMNGMVDSFYGSFVINSQLCKGTRINITLPLAYKEKGDMVV